jgi:hypothetical protein
MQPSGNPRLMTGRTDVPFAIHPQMKQECLPRYGCTNNVRQNTGDWSCNAESGSRSISTFSQRFRELPRDVEFDSDDSSSSSESDSEKMMPKERHQVQNEANTATLRW